MPENKLSAGQNVALLEQEEDVNQLTEYFSYEHFYVIYCKFWELDTDHDLYIDQKDLARHNDQGEQTYHHFDIKLFVFHLSWLHITSTQRVGIKAISAPPQSSTVWLKLHGTIKHLLLMLSRPDLLLAYSLEKIYLLTLSPLTPHFLGWWFVSEVGEIRHKINRRAAYILCSADGSSGTIFVHCMVKVMTRGFIGLSEKAHQQVWMNYMKKMNCNWKSLVQSVVFGLYFLAVSQKMIERIFSGTVTR